MSYFGHVMRRNDGMVKEIMLTMVEDKGRRGQPICMEVVKQIIQPWLSEPGVAYIIMQFNHACNI